MVLFAFPSQSMWLLTHSLLLFFSASFLRSLHFFFFFFIWISFIFFWSSLVRILAESPFRRVNSSLFEQLPAPSSSVSESAASPSSSCLVPALLLLHPTSTTVGLAPSQCTPVLEVTAMLFRVVTAPMSSLVSLSIRVIETVYPWLSGLDLWGNGRSELADLDLCWNLILVLHCFGFSAVLENLE